MFANWSNDRNVPTMFELSRKTTRIFLSMSSTKLATALSCHVSVIFSLLLALSLSLSLSFSISLYLSPSHSVSLSLSLIKSTPLRVFSRVGGMKNENEKNNTCKEELSSLLFREKVLLPPPARAGLFTLTHTHTLSLSSLTQAPLHISWRERRRE